MLQKRINLGSYTARKIGFTPNLFGAKKCKIGINKGQRW